MTPPSIICKLENVFIDKNIGNIKINSISYKMTKNNSTIRFNVTGNIFLFIVKKPHSYTVLLVSCCVFLLKYNSINVINQKIIVIIDIFIKIITNI